MKKRKLPPVLRLLLACYAGGFVLLVLWHFVGFAQNRLAYAGGDLAPATLTAEDFRAEGLVALEDGTLVSVNEDPQLHLLDTARRVENVRVRLRHSKDPITVTAYWAPQGQDHSVRSMAWPQGETGPALLPAGGASIQTDALFLLPAAGGQSLRIDPASATGDIFYIESITINEKRPFFAFFIFSAADWLALCVLPGLLACGLSILRGAVVQKQRPSRKAGDAP